jgi:hypothetical protein
MNPKPDYLNSLEGTGKYVGEFKWNGDNTTVHTNDLSFWNREGKRLCYTPHPAMIEELKRFPKRCRLNGELMHRHTKNVKDLFILHCVMEWENELLLGKQWGDSRNILEGLVWLPRTVETQLKYDRHVLLAQVHKPNDACNCFWNMFQAACACDESIEGIVLKDPTGELKFSTQSFDSVPWMLKIRKPSKKYSF